MKIIGIFRKTEGGGLEFIANFNGTEYQARRWGEWKFPKDDVEVHTVNFALQKGERLENNKFYDEFGIRMSGVLPQGDCVMTKNDKFSEGFKRGVAACWQDVADTLGEILGAVYTPDKEGLLAALEDAKEIGAEDAREEINEDAQADAYEAGRYSGYSQGYNIGRGGKI